VSRMKDLGTLHLCRNSFIEIKTADHLDTFMVVLDEGGNLSFLKTAQGIQRGEIFVVIKAE